jgi:hypothetical protein
MRVEAPAETRAPARLAATTQTLADDGWNTYKEARIPAITSKECADDDQTAGLVDVPA